MKTVPFFLLAASFLSFTDSDAAQSSLVFSGVFDLPTTATPYSIYGTGGTVPYTLTFSYDSVPTRSAFVAEGQVTYHHLGDNLERSAQDMYGYSASSFTAVTMMTEYGSHSFVPGSAYFDTFNFWDQSAQIWFDADISTTIPTSMLIRTSTTAVISNSPPEGHTVSLEAGTSEFTSEAVGGYPPPDPDNAFSLIWDKTSTLSFGAVHYYSDSVVDGGSYTSSYAPVPEPSGALLATVGVALAVGLKRRRP